MQFRAIEYGDKIAIIVRLNFYYLCMLISQCYARIIRCSAKIVTFDTSANIVIFNTHNNNK